MKKLLTITFSLIISCSFAQWTPQNSETDAFLNSVYFMTENAGCIVGSSDVVMMTEDGGASWSMTGQLFPPSSTWIDVHFVNEYEGYVCGTDNTGWTNAWWKYTTNGGNTWNRPSGSSVPNFSAWYSVFFLNEEIGWKVGYRNEGRVSKTTTGVGSDWESIASVPEALYDVIFIDENNGWMAGSNGAIYISIDGGIYWNLQNSETLFDLKSIYFINNMVGWSVGLLEDQAIILKTTNGGQTWTSNLPSGINKLYSIYFLDENIGWACGSKVDNSEDRGVILYTNDGGENWSEQYLYDELSTRFKKLFFINELTGWAVGNNGIIVKTTNAGGTSFEGIEDKKLANSIKLFPNPFSTSTTLSYSLKQPSTVHFSVFNKLGQLVYQRTEEQTQGVQQLQWKAGDQPEGLYYYKLLAGNQQVSGKLIKAK